MSALLDRWAKQATILGAPRRARGFTPITDYDAMRDINLIAGQEAARWREMDRKLRDSGVPTAIAGGFAGLEGVVANGPCQPLPTALTAVAFANGDFSPFNGVTYCPVPNRSPVTCDFYMAATVALAASPGTLLITPGVGTASTAKNLGAGVATATLGTSGTAGLIVWGQLTVRATGSGSAGAWYFTGKMEGKLATSGNGTADVNQLIGYTAATGDSTAQNGLWMTCTGTTANCTISVQQLRFGSWN